MSDLELFNKILKDVNHTLTYESDEVVFHKDEYWKSWTQEVLDGKTGLRDDCDGFALTIAELLQHYGLPNENIAICFCKITGPDGGYHLATKGLCRDDNTWYIMDCNVEEPMTVTEIHSKWGYACHSAMYFNNPGHWVDEEKT